MISEAVRLRPCADVLLCLTDLGETPGCGKIKRYQSLLRRFRGRYMIVSSNLANAFRGHHTAAAVKHVTQPGVFATFCPPDRICGLHASAAIHIAVHFGAREIVLLGMDLNGYERWTRTDINRTLRPGTKKRCEIDEIRTLRRLAIDAERRGVRIVNASPISALTCFERQPLEALV